MTGTPASVRPTPPNGAEIHPALHVLLNHGDVILGTIVTIPALVGLTVLAEKRVAQIGALWCAPAVAALAFGCGLLRAPMAGVLHTALLVLLDLLLTWSVATMTRDPAVHAGWFLARDLALFALSQ
jgi:hypothetical protein